MTHISTNGVQAAQINRTSLLPNLRVYALQQRETYTMHIKARPPATAAAGFKMTNQINYQ